MTPTNIRKGDHYRKEFKHEVISYAAKTSISKATQKFNVHHSSVSLWINEKKHQDLNSAGDGDHYLERCGDLNIGKLCQSSFIDWLSKNLSNLTHETIKEQVNLLKLIYQNIPPWLMNYSERLDDPEYKNRSVHTLYPPEFKSLVVKFLETSNLPQLHVSKIFRVSRKQLTEWQKQAKLKGNLNKAERSSKNLVTSSEVDEAIWNWYQVTGGFRFRPRWVKS
uniref:Transposase n=2 Tax=Cacopsylla melanoneura TaxID=428564 RepID=A0A8D8YE98_9HEMI